MMTQVSYIYTHGLRALEREIYTISIIIIIILLLLLLLLSLFWLCLCKSVTFLATILDIPGHQPSCQARTFAGTTTAAPAMPSPAVATQVGSHGPHGVSRVIFVQGLKVHVILF